MITYMYELFVRKIIYVRAWLLEWLFTRQHQRIIKNIE